MSASGPASASHRPDRHTAALRLREMAATCAAPPWLEGSELLEPEEVAPLRSQQGPRRSLACCPHTPPRPAHHWEGSRHRVVSPDSCPPPPPPPNRATHGFHTQEHFPLGVWAQPAVLILARRGQLPWLGGLLSRQGSVPSLAQTLHSSVEERALALPSGGSPGAQNSWLLVSRPPCWRSPS